MKTINSNNKNYILSHFIIFKMACIFLLSINVNATTELKEDDHIKKTITIVSGTTITKNLAQNENGRRLVYSYCKFKAQVGVLITHGIHGVRAGALPILLVVSLGHAGRESMCIFLIQKV